ncbi:MAG TPA: hypothetical protein VHP37_28820 [Burkholderiales bacterium]|nr:hypothetical protein [Burkholderiales bacterium]
MQSADESDIAIEELDAVVLVDYDNIKPSDEITTKDAADNLIQIRAWVDQALAQLPVRIREVQFRIYGGWTDERGGFTRRGNWVLASLSHVRGLLSGVRYLPALPTSIAAKQLRLRGLYRSAGAAMIQKMVDTLMAVDAMHFCESEPIVLAIATDDDDLVPALMAASIKTKVCKVCCLLRVRATGAAINDDGLQAEGVRIVQVGV